MNIKEFKSGGYEQQYEYRSFLPTPINRECGNSLAEKSRPVKPSLRR